MTDPRRTRLDAVRAETAARIVLLDAELDAVLSDRAQDNADDEHDPEGSTLSGESQRIEALRRSLGEERSEVDAALARVDAGAYGICVACGGPIAPGRLAARPMATLCIACAA
mgnify:CR=1 FL=1